MKGVAIALKNLFLVLSHFVLKILLMRSHSLMFHITFDVDICVFHYVLTFSVAYNITHVVKEIFPLKRFNS